MSNPIVGLHAQHQPSGVLAMTTQTQAPTKPISGIDRPVVAFFAISYVLAWGVWIVTVGLADTSGSTQLNGREAT
jgi:hypothetical protein